MVLDPFSQAVSAVSSVLASTIKVAEKVYEIYAVDEQAKAVLQTVNQVSSQLDSTKHLRRQKSGLLTPFEKQIFDNTIHHTDEAIRQVAALAERARADMDVAGGKVRVNTRMLFVLKDSPNIHVSLTRLSIANQNLNSTFMSLSAIQGRSMSSSSGGQKSPPLCQVELKPPPTYEESQFLSEGRRKNVQRRASAMSLRKARSSASLQPPEGITELPADDSYKPSPCIAVAEVTSSPLDEGFNDLSLHEKANAIPLQTRRVERGKLRSQRWLQARCQS